MFGGYVSFHEYALDRLREHVELANMDKIKWYFENFPNDKKWTEFTDVVASVPRIAVEYYNKECFSFLIAKGMFLSCADFGLVSSSNRRSALAVIHYFRYLKPNEIQAMIEREAMNVPSWIKDLYRSEIQTKKQIITLIGISKKMQLGTLKDHRDTIKVISRAMLQEKYFNKLVEDPQEEDHLSSLDGMMAVLVVVTGIIFFGFYM